MVLALNKYEKDIKSIVNNRVSTIEASTLIEELNCHISAVEIENNYLREQNDNLKHDLNNLIELIKRRIAEQNQTSDELGRRNDSEKCLTFCDVDPEDIFGPIEAITAYNGCCVDESVQVQMAEPPTTGLRSMSADHTPLLDHPDLMRVDGRGDRSLSRCSSASNPNKYIVEEKELLINKLQEHLQTITTELELKDEVLRKLEMKLNLTRKDNSELRHQLQVLNAKYDECESKLEEAVERVATLNEHKRSLMTQLDDEIEQRIKFKEELKALTTRLLENMKTVEHQSITIQHLREAIVSKSRSDSTQLNGISVHSSPAHHL